MEPQRKANIRVVPPPSPEPSQTPQPSVSAQFAEAAYTHGGVKKTKFEPKLPTRRLKKLSAKRDPGLDAPSPAGPDVPKELQRLLLQAESNAQPTAPAVQRTSKVAFGFGGFSSRSSTQSSGSKTSAKPGKGGNRGGSGSSTREKHEFLHEDETRDSKRHTEVFDLERYYPVSLPLRKPFSSDLEEEFLSGDEVHEEDEDAVEAAEELGLTEKKEDDTLYFFQLPKGLPLKEKNASASTSTSTSGSGSGSVRLEDLRGGGVMGKMLVYESGAVKFQVGEVVLDALPGTECTFAQELCAVNVGSNRCGFLGEVYKRVVLTPDVHSVLPEMSELHT